MKILGHQKVYFPCHPSYAIWAMGSGSHLESEYNAYRLVQDLVRGRSDRRMVWWYNLQESLEVLGKPASNRKARKAGCEDALDEWKWNQCSQRRDWKEMLCQGE